MKFVIVKEGSNIIKKEAYGGDDEANAKLILERQAKNPKLTYEEVDENAFVEALIAQADSEEQTDWQKEKAKGTEQALTFIAKRLGLE